MAKNYVCHEAKIECKLCTKPEGKLMVTSNQIKVQDKLFANAKDKEKANLVFEGNCKKSMFQASPCMAVIKPEEWQGVADLIVQDAPALLEDSTIMCAYGGVPIKITDHLQVNEPTETQATDAPVVSPVEDVAVVSAEWKSNKTTDDSKDIKTLHDHDETDKTVTEASEEEKLWLEITTENVMPGQEVIITLEDENDDDSEAITLSAIVDDRGKASVLINSKAEEEKVQQNHNVAQPTTTGEFTKGWWALDAAGEQPITRAVPGMLVYFHIETTIPDGEQIQVKLYDDDNNEKEETGTGDKDDEIPERYPNKSVINSSYETVTNGKVVFKVELDGLQSYLDEEVDKILELYYRCSYNNTVHTELPKSPNDYLAVGTLVIDRYKVPGLNGSGTDIADDLTYGTGHPRLCKDKEGKNKTRPIYDKGQVPKYIEEYKDSGFNEEKHALFTNKENLPAVTSAITPPVIEEEPPKPKKDRFSLIIEETTVKQDNTYVHTPPVPDLNEMARDAAQEAAKNRKAKYGKEEMYSASYGIFDTGEDLKEFHEGKSPLTGQWRDDDYLFWNFKNTAELWFARGELQGNINRMIAKFKSNTGGIYEDPVLTKNIENHPVTKRYCMYMENYIAEKIKQETLKNILGIEDKEPDLDKTTRGLYDKRRKKDKIKGNDILSELDNLPFPLTRPSYSVDALGLIEASKGLTIALNDIWATEVILKELKNDGENYTAKYIVTLWDHFGLDIPDMKKKFNAIPSIKEAFASWFVLQHLRGYKPFVTKMTFEKEFKGNINEGREERRAKLKTKEQALIQAEKLRAQQRAWDKATNPFPVGPKW